MKVQISRCLSSLVVVLFLWLNVHGSVLMYLLERGLINAKAVKSCVLVGMDWEGRGRRESGQDEHKREWM